MNHLSAINITYMKIRVIGDAEACFLQQSKDKEVERMILNGLLERIAEANKTVFEQQGNRRLTPGSLVQTTSRVQLSYASESDYLGSTYLQHEYWESSCL